MRKTILATIAALAMLAATTATASANVVFTAQDPVTGESCEEYGCELQLDGLFTYGTYYDCAISIPASYWNRISDNEIEVVIDDPGLTDDDDYGNGDDCLRKPCDTGAYENPWSLKFKYHAAIPQLSLSPRVVASLQVCGENGSGQQFVNNSSMTLTAPSEGSWTYESFDWLTGSAGSVLIDAQSDDDLAFSLVEQE